MSSEEAQARAAGEALAAELSGALSQLQALRSSQQHNDGRLERQRHERDQIRAELLSLEALQKAALGEKHPQAASWIAGIRSIVEAPRLAQLLEVEQGWERAVETVLGDYLEAVRVDSLEELESSLRTLAGGSVGFFETAATSGAAPQSKNPHRVAHFPRGFVLGRFPYAGPRPDPRPAMAGIRKPSPT